MADSLHFVPVLSRLDLVSSSVADCVRAWTGSVPVAEFWVAEIDVDAAGGPEFCERYGVPRSEGANCVIVEGQRGPSSTFAACVAPVGYRLDLNSTVRKQLGARRVALAPAEATLAATEMEYGSITPIGLPTSWLVLLHPLVLSAPRVVVGSGLLRSKLSVPGRALLDLPGALAVEGLAFQVS